MVCNRPIPGEQPGHPKVALTHGDQIVQDIHGISTHKVYPSAQLPDGIVRSYHTFSPLLRLAERYSFCDPVCTSSLPEEIPPVRWCGALRCPDFPPHQGGAIERLAYRKNTKKRFGGLFKVIISAKPFIIKYFKAYYTLIFFLIPLFVNCAKCFATE